MMKRGSALWLSAVLLAGAPAYAADDEAVKRTDNALEDHIEARLKHRKLGQVDVDVENGVATLKGDVATAAEKARATQLATVKGVSRVDNQLEIDAGRAKDKLDDQARAQKDKIEASAERQKDAVDRKTEQAKARVDKAEENGSVVTPVVTTSVKAKFIADDLVKASEVNVDTSNDGVVTLRGTVPSAAAHTRALELARSTDGVRKVVDHLKVAP